jgi:hypothetical protein
MKEAWSSFYSTLPSQGGNKKTQFQPRNTNPQQQQNNQKQWTGSIPLEKAQYYDRRIMPVAISTDNMSNIALSSYSMFSIVLVDVKV